MVTSIPNLLVVLLLFSEIYIVTTSTPCDVESRFVATSVNHSLSVNATLTDDNITLKCLTVNGTLASNQYFKWTEGGQEIISSQMITIENTNSHSILTIHNATFHHYGEYTCQCYNTFTTEDIQSIIADNNQTFYPKCSQPTSTLVLPTGSTATISYHEVDTPGSSVNITCTSDLELIHVTGNENEVSSPWNVVVDDPSDQGKFLCVDESDIIKEIQYVVIKDYEPLQLILPTRPNENVLVTYDSGYKVPVCVVYSNINLIRLSFFLYPPLFGLFDSQLKEFNGGIYIRAIETSLVATFEVFSHLCIAQTKWQRSEIHYDIKFVKQVYVTAAFVDLPDLENNITSGSNLTFYCRICTNGGFDNIEINITHYKENGTKLMLEPIRKNSTSTSDSYELYFVLLNEVSEEDEGVYTCHVSLNSLQREDSVTISVIPESKAGADIVMTSTYTKLPETSLTTNSISKRLSSSSSSTTTTTTTDSPSTTESIVEGESIDSMEMIYYIIIAAVGVSIIMFLFGVCFVVLIICLRKRQRQRVETENKSSPQETCQSEEIPRSNNNNDEVPSLLLPTTRQIEADRIIQSFSLTSISSLIPELSNPMSRIMMECIRELFISTLYIPYDKLELYEDLGSGAFGKVKRARINESSIVAVKMLKDFPIEEEERDLIAEFKVLQSIGKHENIVNLIGGSIHNSQLLVIVEYCSGGNLLDHLRKKRSDAANPLSVPHQLHMGLQVACGMEYLSSKKCVHRDLAARNILLTANGTLKVADFGLARETYHSVYKKTTKGRIPFKWMAPESVFDKVYTTKSDVWSFGMLLWEIFTLGQSPYPGKTVDETITDLQAQKLMERPATCPVNVFDIILQCWRFDPNDRPNFNMLVQTLESVLISGDCSRPSYCSDECLCDGCSYSSNTEETSINEHPTPSRVDLHNEEQQSYLKILSIIASSNPSLAENIDQLCPNCKQSYVYYYYYNYIYSENYKLSNIEGDSGEEVFNKNSKISLCSSCKLDFQEHIEKHLMCDEGACDVFNTPTEQTNIVSVLTENSDSGMIQDLSYIDLEKLGKNDEKRCQVVWQKETNPSKSIVYLQSTL